MAAREGWDSWNSDSGVKEKRRTGCSGGGALKCTAARTTNATDITAASAPSSHGLRFGAGAGVGWIGSGATLDTLIDRVCPDFSRSAALVRSTANSAAEPYRLFASFSKHFAVRNSSSIGTPTRTPVSGSGCSLTIS